MKEEADYEEEYRERRRGRQPRFGSFVTIAMALLMLFGAASRLGKVPETLSLFGIDASAREHIRIEDERARTIINLGAQPIDPRELHPDAGRVRINPNPLPPQRGEFDIGHSLRPGLSMPVPLDNPPEDDQYDEPEEYPDVRRSLRPEPVRTPEPQSRHYVVANGDTWNKIALRTLGDGKRWKELLQANPEAQNGLKVGMRLVVP